MPAAVSLRRRSVCGGESGGDSHDFAQRATEDEGGEIGEEGDEKSRGEFFPFDSGEVDRADIKNRFGGAVGDAGAAGGVAVHAVTGNDVGEDGGGTAPRQGLDQRQPRDFFRNAEQAKDGRDESDDLRF